ncbi:RagB/SusD family nutrient uptake outer membrane protein [Salinimicrobium sp. MT39]|uniref:RagB/SusD family nutrient uptake outer membrane protein n=1 Tax=Salinimicrobium profundisediminis TaxID=2994553 RepID=A0A9X3I1I2_9FLAO|nr:RagB/SusD family nutrient uptake outer membrane protein [Salinimicrobium profundisediminis]MCX2839105.1 RagB/SusD family nutrient uptake outer membrane protein [Salinimicrobium profundisediminis]
MKTTAIIYKVMILVLCGFFISCEDYLEIDVPDHKIVSATVFENDEIALSALDGLYNQIAAAHFTGGGASSVTVLAALSSDILNPFYTTNLPYMEFDQHELLPDNFRNTNLWTSAYNIIYMSNALLEGVADSKSISQDVRTRLEGEAKFVRAFIYFYLVNLYGEVPLILTTDYRTNALATRNPEEEIYMQIKSDLQTAIDLLGVNYLNGERTRVNYYGAVAFMARIELYKENWEKAEILSSEVISQTGTYEILENLNEVFLANSKEAIWQLSPIGRGDNMTNTHEGANFIIDPIYSFFAQFKLNPIFVDSFATEDKRLTNWVGFHPATTYYYPYKYKIRNDTEEVTEYSMVLRLAEQYLIRAEARAMQDNISGAVSDLDKIRERAGLDLIANVDPGIGREQLLELIFQERKKELFTEWGHRWLDLKRIGNTGEVLGEAHPQWQETDVYFPIPEPELLTNPNLTQNDGY